MKKKIFKKIVYFLMHPSFILIRLDNRNIIRLSDKLYIKLLYKERMNLKLNLKNPQTFNEKLQWLKLYDRKDIYTTMVDKYEAKKYVASIIGDEYIIPTLGVYDKFDDIDFDSLPNKFVIKCTHDSGGLIICKDKSTLDIKYVEKKINNCLQQNFFFNGREWPYKNVKPRIIIEKYMEDKNLKVMRDYKFFCFDGEPKIMYISEGLENHKTASISFYDMNFNLIDCKRKDYKQLDYIPKKPINFDKMKEKSAILSKNIPHIRVDWYEINGNLYFGELTFFTCDGMLPFADNKWNKKLGEYINLKISKEQKK